METILSLSIALASPARAERALKMCIVALLNRSTFQVYFGYHLLNLYFIKILSGSRNYTSRVHHGLGRTRQTSFSVSIRLFGFYFKNSCLL